LSAGHGPHDGSGARERGFGGTRTRAEPGRSGGQTTDVTEEGDQISREACRRNSRGDTDWGRGWSACHPMCGAAYRSPSTAGTGAASASEAAGTDGFTTTVAQQVNAAEVSPWWS